MIATALWVAWLSLRRDRVSLLLTFVLPPVLFMAFAMIFSNAPGRDLKLKLAVADLAGTPASHRLVAALENAGALRVIPLPRGSAADAADLVERGSADAGLVVHADPGVHGQAPPLGVLEAPDRPLAASMALGQVQRVFAEAMPDVLLRRILDDLQGTDAIDAGDRAFLDEAFAKESRKRADARLSFSKLATIEPLATPQSGRNGGVLQYAAAVSAIFLLFGAVQGAYGLIDERESGVADRVRLAAGGMAGPFAGRMLFLVLQGVAQVSAIYLTAMLAYGATFPVALLPAWMAACVAGAAACAGLAMLACALSRTRRQAELCSTFAVLLLSTLGGSMVPRYLMPAWLQAASWWTPNAWIMHALGQSVVPGADPTAITASLAVLSTLAASTFVLTLAVA